MDLAGQALTGLSCQVEIVERQGGGADAALGAASRVRPARRLGVIYVPNGVIMDRWTPAAEGRGFEWSPTLQPLEPFRDRVLVLSGLDEFKLHIFGHAYDFPFPGVFAYFDGLAEIVLPVLLVLGFATRFSALALLVMTGVIQLVVPEGWANFHLP